MNEAVVVRFSVVRTCSRVKGDNCMEMHAFVCQYITDTIYQHTCMPVFANTIQGHFVDLIRSI